MLDYAALTDIGHDYFNGRDCVVEWYVLSNGLYLHLIFILCVFLTIYFAFRTRQNHDVSKFLIINESVFVIMNIIGLICGGIGLAVTYLLSYINTPPVLWNYIILPVCFIIILPYAAIIFFRFTNTLNKVDSNTFDEKQKLDLYKSGISTWLVSLPCMLIVFMLYYLNVPGFTGLVWFPYFLFISLLLFSGQVLYFFKKV
jgi:hypothetical protein